MPDTAIGAASLAREAFARKTPYEDRGLVSLFRLFDQVPPGDKRSLLSGVVRDRLRAIFPRGSGKTGVVDLVNGLRVEVDLGDLFGAEFFVGHCNEKTLIDALTATLPGGARIVDVGANFGVYALHAGLAAGDEGRVVAFEPAPTAHRLLAANVKRNNLSDRIKIKRAAVAAEDGKAMFQVAEEESFSGLRATGRSPTQTSVEVRQVALDREAAVQALLPIDFLKIDTEGGEADVLAGARNTIRQSPSLVVLMEYSFKNLTPKQTKAIRTVMSELIGEGLRVWSIDQAGAIKPVTAVAAIPKSFNGSIVFARPKAAWAEAFLAAISARAAGAPQETPIELAGVEAILEALHQSQDNLGLLTKLEARLDGAGEGILGDRILKYVEGIEADGARLKALHNTHAESSDGVAREKEIDDLRAAIQSLEAKLTAARGEYGSVHQRLVNKEEEVEWHRQKLAQQREDNASLHNRLVQKDAEFSMILQRNAELRDHVGSLSDHVRTKSEEIVRLSNQREADAAERGELRAKWERSVEAQRARADGLEASLAGQRQDAAAIEEKRAALGRHIEALNQKLAELGAAKEAERAQLQQIVEERNTALKAAEQAYAEQVEQVQILEGRITEAASAHKAEVIQLRGLIEEREKSLALSESRRGELRQHINTINRKLSDIAEIRSKETSDFTEELSARTREIAALRESAKALQAGMSESGMQLSAAAAERDTAKVERDTAKVERDAATAQRDAATAQRDEATAQRDAAAAERDAAKTERDAATNRLEAARLEFDRQKKALEASGQKLEQQVQEMSATLDEQRARIRSLQQQTALFSLGRRKVLKD